MFACTEEGHHPPRLMGVFVPRRLCVYSLILAAFYSVFFISLYRAGIWLADNNGVPIHTDFTNNWTAGAQALHGKAGSVYNKFEQASAQHELVGTVGVVFKTWPYPPIYLLILAPFGMLSYFQAFLSWDLLTLLGSIGVVYSIAGRRCAIPFLLASPFIAWNLSSGQSGLLMASLFGAFLLLLERRPVLAGFLIGCLSFKPHFGILVPVALLASNQWRALASAAATVALLVAVSVALFGSGAWVGFPESLADQANLMLFVDAGNAPIASMGLQTIYGLVRGFHGRPWQASLAQGVAALTAAAVIWLVWRSSARFPLKVAVLSAAALLASPYAYAYDMAAIIIPLSFLVKDQISHGFSSEEQATTVALLAAGLVILVSFGTASLGPIVIIALLWIILRRDLSWWVASRYVPRKATPLHLPRNWLVRPARDIAPSRIGSRLLDP